MAGVTAQTPQGYKNVSHEGVIPVLAEAVKELDGRVSTLQADNNNLRHELDELTAELHAQQ